MGLIRVSDFAKEVSCTPQNIYKHIRNYSNELEGHTQQSRRGLLLDDYAQEFIRGVMYPKELSTEASRVMDDLNALRAEYLKLAAKHTELATQLAQTEGERDRALMEAGQSQKLLAASQEQQEQQAQELAAARQEAQDALKAAQEAQAKAHAAEERLEALRGRSWFERLMRKGEDF